MATLSFYIVKFFGSFLNLALRSDNFMAFFKARETALLDRIERAIVKPIAREIAQEDDTSHISDTVNEYQDEEEE